MLNGRRRWPFVAVQLGVLAAAVYFLVDGTKGGSVVSFLLAAASVAALAFAVVEDVAERKGA
jgi:hypothetical protein